MKREIDLVMGNDELAEELGLKLARILGLKKNKRGFYETDWGVKSNIGLARCVSAIFEEELCK